MTPLLPQRGMADYGNAQANRFIDLIVERLNALIRAGQVTPASGIPDFAFFNDSGGSTERGYVYGFGTASAKAISGASPVHPRWIADASVAQGQWCPFSLPGKAVRVRAESLSASFTKGGPVWLSDSVAGTVTGTEPTSGTYYWMGQARESSPGSDGFIWINPALEPEARAFL